nr:PREDICTED: MORC family CW-type zinc finger protein 4 [Latimeria chalumnae]|eukprot:XP_014347109.1 PREDICTED: MORC family CW-type zinc finger protein 4 [Latimeria chalumnae]
MAKLSEYGIRLSAMSPSYLYSNSTSHTWPFSAIAELIGNTEHQFTPHPPKMLSFGFTNKPSTKTHAAIGVYGNGFKSGSMRLGKDAIIFTKNGGALSVGLLSQTYLEKIRAQAVIVPIVPFNQQNKKMIVTEDSAPSLDAILKYSLFTSQEELLAEFDTIPSKKGTRIIIWNIRRNKDGVPELDFETDKFDIRIPDISTEGAKSDGKKGGRQPERQDQVVPESDYSLRAYCSILYLKPRIQIILRQKKVKTQLITKSLANIEHDIYKPNFINKRVKITFGFNCKNKEHFGIMMYHKNRLIKSYEKVGCQIKSNTKRGGIGVIGVIECNFLKPAHNKQDFEYTKEYRLTLAAVGQKLNDYWCEKKLKKTLEEAQSPGSRKETGETPDQAWVQCDECLKWRKLPPRINPDSLPEKWYCYLNPDSRYRNCSVREEQELSDDEVTPSYEKTSKKQDQNSERRKSQSSEQDSQQSSKNSEKMLSRRRRSSELSNRSKEEYEEEDSGTTESTVCNYGDNARASMSKGINSSHKRKLALEDSSKVTKRPQLDNEEESHLSFSDTKDKTFKTQGQNKKSESTGENCMTNHGNNDDNTVINDESVSPGFLNIKIVNATSSFEPARGNEPCATSCGNEHVETSALGHTSEENKHTLTMAPTDPLGQETHQENKGSQGDLEASQVNVTPIRDLTGVPDQREEVTGNVSTVEMQSDMGDETQKDNCNKNQEAILKKRVENLEMKLTDFTQKLAHQQQETEDCDFMEIMEERGKEEEKSLEEVKALYQQITQERDSLKLGMEKAMKNLESLSTERDQLRLQAEDLEKERNQLQCECEKRRQELQVLNAQKARRQGRWWPRKLPRLRFAELKVLRVKVEKLKAEKKEIEKKLKETEQHLEVLRESCLPTSSKEETEQQLGIMVEPYDLRIRKEPQEFNSIKQKLRALRINVGHLLAFVLPHLELQEVSFDTDQIDDILQKVLEINEL